MKTLNLEDFKANTKEWFLEQLGNMSAPQALQAISDLYDELHKPKYPTTYEECCEMLNTINSGNSCIALSYLGRPIFSLAKLIIMRDAYWKIAGEQMGLDKPWEPDYDSGVNKYGIICMNGVVQKSNPTTNWERHLNKVLDFPTEKMRDAFYDNFKELIENCKELI